MEVLEAHGKGDLIPGAECESGVRPMPGTEPLSGTRHVLSAACCICDREASRQVMLFSDAWLRVCKVHAVAMGDADADT